MASELLDQFFIGRSTVYAALENAKKAVEQSQDADAYFSRVQSRHEHSLKAADADSAQRFVQISRTVLKEVDIRYFNQKLFQPCVRFIDVGCAPGGFATYVMEVVEQPRYMGVTLPYDEGGHPLAIPESEKFWCLQVDITKDPLSVRYSPSPANVENLSLDQRVYCDCALLACSYLGGRKSKFMMPQISDSAVPSAVVDHACYGEDVSPDDKLKEYSLLVAQLLIAIHNLGVGGVLVMLVNTGPTPLFCSFLCNLWSIFSHVHVAKPLTNHNIRRSFYLVCRGFLGQENEQVQRCLGQLVDMYKQLSDGTLLEFMPVIDQSGVILDNLQRILEVWGDSLMKLLEPIWSLQLFFLDQWLRNMSGGSHVMLSRYTRLCADHLHGHCNRKHCNDAHDWQQLKGAGVPLKRFLDKMQGPKKV